MKAISSRDGIPNTKTEFRHAPLTDVDRESLLVYVLTVKHRVLTGQTVPALRLLDGLITALGNR